jgi:hypothetical protein
MLASSATTAAWDIPKFPTGFDRRSDNSSVVPALQGFYSFVEQRWGVIGDHAMATEIQHMDVVRSAAIAKTLDFIAEAVGRADDFGADDRQFLPTPCWDWSLARRSIRLGLSPASFPFANSSSQRIEI